MRCLADRVYLSHLDDLRLLALGLSRPVPAARQTLILVIWISLSAIVLLVLPVKDLLLVLLEGTVAGGVDLVGDQGLDVCTHWLAHSVHVLFSAELLLV